MTGIIDTSSSTFRQIMGNGIRYEIPKFQRDYSWDSEQWSDLWEDILVLLRNEEQEHYLGYLVMQTADNKVFQVIDGQQRLTTISIIILAVIKSLENLCEKGIDPDNNQKRKQALINSYIGYINPVTLISENKLKLNRNSDFYYRQYLVLLNVQPSRNRNNSEKQLREAFLFYLKKVENTFTNGESLAGFIDEIVDKLYFSVIKVSNQINAFKVFETLNARGVQLSSSDLLKNYLFSIVDNTSPHQNEIDELENLWGKIVDKLREKKFEDFLRCYWNSSHKSVSKRNLYKEIRNVITTKKETFELLRELLDIADIYIAIQDPNDELWKNNKEISEELQILKLFRITQTFSLFLAGYKYLDEKTFRKLVKCCTIISFRYNVIGGLNPNKQEDVYNDTALKISSLQSFEPKDLEKIYESDENFIPNFQMKSFVNTSSNHKIVRYIFAKIEAITDSNQISFDGDNYSIEHILPENPDENWNQFTDDQIERCKYRLGNLTLLEKNLNNNCGTKSFEQKVNYYKKSNSKLTQSICDHYSEWTEDTILQRQKYLAKVAKVIWKIDF